MLFRSDTSYFKMLQQLCTLICFKNKYFISRCVHYIRMASLCEARRNLGFERDEDNVLFYWDNTGPGSIVPIPLTLYYHGGGVLPLSRSNENFSTKTISHVLVWKWLWDEGLYPGGIWRASIVTKEVYLRLNYVHPSPLPC